MTEPTVKLGQVRAWIGGTLMLCIVACGGSHGTGSSDPPTPGVTDPQFGAAGNVLAADRVGSSAGDTAELWIGFASETGWQTYLQLRAHEEIGRIPFVGGRVVADSNRDLGFYFDPATTEAAEVVAGGFVTTLDALSRDPAGAVADDHPWFVAIEAKRVVSTSSKSTRRADR